MGLRYTVRGRWWRLVDHLRWLAGKHTRVIGELPVGRVRLLGGWEPPVGEVQLVYVVLAQKGGGVNERVLVGRVDKVVVVSNRGGGARKVNIVLRETPYQHNSTESGV